MIGDETKGDSGSTLTINCPACKETVSSEYEDTVSVCSCGLIAVSVENVRINPLLAASS